MFFGNLPRPVNPAVYDLKSVERGITPAGWAQIVLIKKIQNLIFTITYSLNSEIMLLLVKHCTREIILIWLIFVKVCPIFFVKKIRNFDPKKSLFCCPSTPTSTTPLPFLLDPCAHWVRYYFIVEDLVDS